MKDYFLEIVKDGVRIDVAHTKANTQEEANAIITKAGIGRGMENFSVREVTQEDFDAFRAKQKPDDDKQAEAERLAAEEAEKNAATAAAGAEAPADPATSDPAAPSQDQQPSEDNSESLAGDSQGTPSEGTETNAAA